MSSKRYNSHIKRLLLNTVYVYFTVLVTWCVLVVAIGTPIQPEAFAFYLELDAPIITLSTLALIYIFYFLDKTVVQPQFVIISAFVSVTTTLVTNLPLFPSLIAVTACFIVSTAYARYATR